MSEVEEIVSAFVIGDPHLKAKFALQNQDFVERCVSAAREADPNFIVILGDTLDTHEIIRTQPFNLACDFIDQLSQIADTYVLIGNHDMINQSQFLTTQHPFNTLKKWKNVTIVDEPIIVSYGENDQYEFFMCPYVPDGRFHEAMDVLTHKNELWDIVTCGFAHQKFNGCKMGAKIADDGDDWDENFPPIISGHIHDAQVVGNIYYPGSAMQHAFGESGKKRVWHVRFGASEEYPYFEIEKINLGMKEKRIVDYHVDDINSFDVDQCKKHDIRINLAGTPSDFKVFRKSAMHATLKRHGVKIAFQPITEGLDDLRQQLSGATLEKTCFETVLREIVDTKDDNTQNAYVEMMCDVDRETAEEEIRSHYDDLPKELCIRDIVKLYNAISEDEEESGDEEESE